MKSWALLICVIGTLLSPQDRKASGDKLPILPGASLLVGTPPFFLIVTNTHENIRLQAEDPGVTRDSASIYPSISRNGKVIAYARLKASLPQRIVAISTYSTMTNEVKSYSEGEYSGAVAISQDAARLAFSASRRRVEGSGDDHLHIIDLRTGQETLGPDVPSFTSVFVSWSPDSRRLVYGFEGEIRVWDSVSGEISKIADGDAPAWSPSGEWIAYLEGIPDRTSSLALGRTIYQTNRWGSRCLIVHPDGSGKNSLSELPHKKNFPRFLVEAPVWSPDSKMILLNELADVDKWTMNIHRLNIKTLTLKTVFRDTMPVLGWAEGQ
jgi:Tol biopolymer transport system component